MDVRLFPSISHGFSMNMVDKRLSLTPIAPAEWSVLRGFAPSCLRTLELTGIVMLLTNAVTHLA